MNLSEWERPALSERVSIIDLSEASAVGSGNARRAYRHPEDPRFLLKVQEAAVEEKVKLLKRRLSIAPSNERELAGYADITRRLGGKPDYLTEVRGLVETSQGAALMVDDALYGDGRAEIVNRLFKAGKGPFSRDEVAAARAQYEEIAALFQRTGIYNHCLRPESVVLAEGDGGVGLRLFDCKTLVYRQAIHPRLIPGARRYIQGLIIEKTLGKFDTLIGKL
ncbi:MAG: YrbL family protein [Pseudomonadota bacterium]